MILEKELEENLVIGSSMQFGFELLVKEIEIFIVGKQFGFDSEFLVVFFGKGKLVVKIGLESDQCLLFGEEKVYV